MPVAGEHAVEAAHWHPVADAASVSAEAPLAVRLLGADLVIWRGADRATRAAADRCPHRGTRLSLGRVRAGELECAYHGWRFGGDGRCVAIPALPEFAPPSTHALRLIEALEAHGLVWLRGAAGDAPLPQLSADAPQRQFNVGPYEVATSAPRVVENFLDLAHFAFVHDGLLGERDHAALADYRVESGAHGFVAHGCEAWQPQSNRLSRQGSAVRYRYELKAPYCAVLTKLPERQQGYRDEIALFVCPLDHERSRVWFRLAVTDDTSTDDELRAFQHMIFCQDRPVLESQQPRRLPLAPGDELQCAADRSSAAYRRFLLERGITFGVTRP